ncbi:unnamed protein product [Acanthoscelides obtectus]|uniref:Cyclic nucleotide-binding domain-containing protein n=1 Tax=Acanthoscelides obtectus TaxID=200917 RepID=A0A9P0Q794_ACAOB|nr:unnamed protein product [Acanthoscelides obtectus]CAK1684519.1 Potassium/sodium hyperpolarization-activated cyclic nucleotide-gated channel 4 [Acanthoscelides obtectus]
MADWKIPKHHCVIHTADDDDLFGDRVYMNCWERLRAKWMSLIIVAESPLSDKIFKSKATLRRERIKQLESDHPYVIHPLSKFRAWYGVYQLLLYLCLILSNTIDGAFSHRLYHKKLSSVKIAMILEVLALIDMIIIFNTGYIIADKNTVEMRPRRIAKHYVRSPYFFCDLASSIPKNIPYLFVRDEYQLYPDWVLGIFCLLLFSRMIRIVTFIQLLYRSAEYFECSSKSLLFVLTCAFITFISIHFMACMQFAVPRFATRYFVKHEERNAWIHNENVDSTEKSFISKYVICFFKSSAYILGVYLPLFIHYRSEEYVLAIATYLTGKLLCGAVWVVLAIYLLTRKAMQIRFFELTNQLEAYIDEKKFPSDLGNKLLDYYTFKYQRKFINEQKILGLLSDNLKRDVRTHICKKLVKSITTFNDLREYDIDELVSKLVPQIYLPMETIVRSGSVADGCYIISSGTVALYTHSGKEVYHLQDGALFGEISLLIRDQETVLGTAIAIETSQVYKFLKRDLERFLKAHKQIAQLMIKKAEKKKRMLAKFEKEARRMLFEQTYKTTNNPGDEYEGYVEQGDQELKQ